MLSNLPWASLLAFCLSALCCFGFKTLARRFFLLDIPDVRKRHEGVIPVCGGLAMFVAFYLTLSAVFIHDLINPSPDKVNLSLFVLFPGLFLLLVSGVIDDRFNLPALPRLGIQYLAAAFIVGIAGLFSLNLGTPLSVHPTLAITIGAAELSGVLYFFVAMTFIVGLSNAVNMSDGVDGLAGSASLASLFWLIMIAASLDAHHLVLQMSVLAATMAGFLLFNMRSPLRRRATVFMGDGGSTVLGAALAGFILMLSARGNAVSFPILLLVVMVPMLDTLSLMARRMAARRSPFSADRQHLHHFLMDTGLTQGQTAAAVMAMNFIAGSVAFAAIVFKLPLWTVALSAMLIAALHTTFVLRMTREAKLVLVPQPVEPANKNETEVKFPGVIS